MRLPKLAHWSDALDLLGVAALVTAGFLLHIALGFAVLGVCLIGLGNLKWGER